jgi:hypothetical protein
MALRRVCTRLYCRMPYKGRTSDNVTERVFDLDVGLKYLFDEVVK